jgi:hypothetical protein
VTGLDHDHEPPLTAQSRRRLHSVPPPADADPSPACRTRAVNVDRIGLGVDDLADPVTGFAQHGVMGGVDERAALDLVAVGLQDRRDLGAARVFASGALDN